MKTPTIRFKLCLGMLCLSLAVICLCLPVLDHVVEDLIGEEVESSLETGRGALQELLQLRWNLIVWQGHAMAQSPPLRTAMNIPDVDEATLYQAVRPLYDAAHADLMLIVDPEGRLLTEVSGPGGHAKGVPTGADLLVLMGEYDGLWVYGGESYEIVAVPVSIEDRHLGHLILGNRLDAGAADYISLLTGNDIIIAADGVTMAQSRAASGDAAFESQDIAVIQTALADRTQSDAVLAAGDTESFMVLQTQMAEGGASVVFVRSLTDVDAKLSGIRKWILAGGAGLVALSLLFSLSISGRITRPVRTLRDAAEQIRRGGLEKRVAIESTDEVGELARSFNAMVDELAAAQGELTEANRTLEVHVDERTADLATANRNLAASWRSAALPRRRAATLRVSWRRSAPAPCARIACAHWEKWPPASPTS